MSKSFSNPDPLLELSIYFDKMVSLINEGMNHQSVPICNHLITQVILQDSVKMRVQQRQKTYHWVLSPRVLYIYKKKWIEEMVFTIPIHEMTLKGSSNSQSAELKWNDKSIQVNFDSCAQYTLNKWIDFVHILQSFPNVDNSELDPSSFIDLMINKKSYKNLMNLWKRR